MRILVADDCPAMRDMFTTILSQKGHEVITAYDGLEALSTYHKATEGFDFVLSDYHMPRLNGLAFLACVLDSNPQQRVALVSSAPPSKDTLPDSLKSVRIFDKMVDRSDLFAFIES